MSTQALPTWRCMECGHSDTWHVGLRGLCGLCNCVKFSASVAYIEAQEPPAPVDWHAIRKATVPQKPAPGGVQEPASETVEWAVDLLTEVDIARAKLGAQEPADRPQDRSIPCPCGALPEHALEVPPANGAAELRAEVDRGTQEHADPPTWAEVSRRLVRIRERQADYDPWPRQTSHERDVTALLQTLDGMIQQRDMYAANVERLRNPAPDAQEPSVPTDEPRADSMPYLVNASEPWRSVLARRVTEEAAPGGAQEPADPPDDFDLHLSVAMADPAFAAAYEDAGQRHRILDALVSRRKALCLTQTDVARRMGVTQPTVSGFETEHSDPRISTLHRYARAVDATVELRIDRAATVDWHTS